MQDDKPAPQPPAEPHQPSERYEMSNEAPYSGKGKDDDER